MQINLQVIERGRTRLVQTSTLFNSFPRRIATLVIAVLLSSPGAAAFAKGTTQTSSGASEAQQQQQPAPSASPTQQRQGPPPGPTPNAQTSPSGTQPGTNQQGPTTPGTQDSPRALPPRNCHPNHRQSHPTLKHPRAYSRQPSE